MNYLLWQLADSGFPAGGFAHSGGLEAAVQHGLVADVAGVRAFARHSLIQAARTGVPLLSAVHREPSRLTELDRFSNAFLTNPVARRASCAQGRGWLATSLRSFPDSGIEAIQERMRLDTLACHYAPVFGAVTALLQVEARDAQRLFLYLAFRSVCSAAVRLGVIGAYDAQEIQSQLSGEIDAICDRTAGLDPLDVAHTAPLLDLLQSTHDRLYSRLFQS